MASSKRERQRARKSAGGTTEGSARMADASAVAGVDASRPARQPTIDVKRGDWWRLYGQTFKVAWMTEDDDRDA